MAIRLETNASTSKAIVAFQYSEMCNNILMIVFVQASLIRHGTAILPWYKMDFTQVFPKVADADNSAECQCNFPLNTVSTGSVSDFWKNTTDCYDTIYMAWHHRWHRWPLGSVPIAPLGAVRCHERC